MPLRIHEFCKQLSLGRPCPPLGGPWVILGRLFLSLWGSWADRSCPWRLLPLLRTPLACMLRIYMCFWSQIYESEVVLGSWYDAWLVHQKCRLFVLQTCSSSNGCTNVPFSNNLFLYYIHIYLIFLRHIPWVASMFNQRKG